MSRGVGQNDLAAQARTHQPIGRLLDELVEVVFEAVGQVVDRDFAAGIDVAVQGVAVVQQDLGDLDVVVARPVRTVGEPALSLFGQAVDQDQGRPALVGLLEVVVKKAVDGWFHFSNTPGFGACAGRLKPCSELDGLDGSRDAWSIKTDRSGCLASGSMADFLQTYHAVTDRAIGFRSRLFGRARLPVRSEGGVCESFVGLALLFFEEAGQG